MNEAKIGFQMKKVRLPLTAILPLRHVKDPKANVRRYKSILASIKEVGLIEPLVVYPQTNGQLYLLLDGHLRHYALRELQQEEADCIISSDDESYTYNIRVSRLAPIQEHKMILKAVNNGVRPEKIAAALDIPLSEVRATITLMDGIHEEAADLLKAKPIVAKSIRLLKKVTGVRQIEIAELMVSANNFTAAYAEALILGTPKNQLLHPDEPKRKEGLSTEDIARMEQEMASLEQDFKAVESSYGENMLNLTLARGYIKKLLENSKVVRYLNAHHGEILSEFETIVAADAL